MGLLQILITDDFKIKDKVPKVSAYFFNLMIMRTELRFFLLYFKILHGIIIKTKLLLIKDDSFLSKDGTIINFSDFKIKCCL